MISKQLPKSLNTFSSLFCHFNDLALKSTNTNRPALSEEDTALPGLLQNYFTAINPKFSQLDIFPSVTNHNVMLTDRNDQIQSSYYLTLSLSENFCKPY